jgi:hypothetical protein
MSALKLIRDRIPTIAEVERLYRIEGALTKLLEAARMIVKEIDDPDRTMVVPDNIELTHLSVWAKSELRAMIAAAEEALKWARGSRLRAPRRGSQC